MITIAQWLLGISGILLFLFSLFLIYGYFAFKSEMTLVKNLEAKFGKFDAVMIKWQLANRDRKYPTILFCNSIREYVEEIWFDHAGTIRGVVFKNFGEIRSKLVEFILNPDTTTLTAEIGYKGDQLFSIRPYAAYYPADPEASRRLRIIEVTLWNTISPESLEQLGIKPLYY